MLTLYIVSLATKPPVESEVSAYIWTRKIFDAESAELASQPWYYNYRRQSMALLALTALVVILFW